MSIGARGKKIVADRCLAIGGQHDDRQPPKLSGFFLRADLLDRAAPIEFRHRKVGDDEVVGCISAGPFHGFGDKFTAICHNGDAMALPCEVCPDHERVDRVVLGEKNVERGIVRRTLDHHRPRLAAGRDPPGRRGG